MSILTTQNLSLSFGDFDLFQGISVTIEQPQQDRLDRPKRDRENIPDVDYRRDQ